MLIDKIREDHKTYRKSRDEVASSILGLVISKATQVAREKEIREPTDPEVTQVIRKEIKGCTEMLSMIRGKDQTEAETKATREKELLESLLPKQLTEDELLAVIQGFIDSVKSENKPVNQGSIMQFLKTQYAGLYDGKTASTIAKSLL